ncbi:MAG TPA: hypothetical protein VN783_01275 [Thermoanaerobaculia bacterium]|nr:hypothetical protein [Thermoanaerobaculia bacterium]
MARNHFLTLAVEGDSDAAVARRLASGAGFTVATCHVAGGKHRLDRRLPGYLRASRFGRWLVLRDLDHDAPCAPELHDRLRPPVVEFPNLLLRIAVRSVESWLLADREGLGRFLGISVDSIPSHPDRLDRPKRTLVDLARKSRSREIRDDMVPERGISAEVGPGYVARLVEFSVARWNPESAARSSPSLLRCTSALKRLFDQRVNSSS